MTSTDCEKKINTILSRNIIFPSDRNILFKLIDNNCLVKEGDEIKLNSILIPGKNIIYPQDVDHIKNLIRSINNSNDKTFKKLINDFIYLAKNYYESEFNIDNFKIDKENSNIKILVYPKLLEPKEDIDSFLEQYINVRKYLSKDYKKNYKFRVYFDKNFGNKVYADYKLSGGSKDKEDKKDKEDNENENEAVKKKFNKFSEDSDSFVKYFHLKDPTKHNEWKNIFYNKNPKDLFKIFLNMLRDNYFIEIYRIDLEGKNFNEVLNKIMENNSNLILLSENFDSTNKNFVDWFKTFFGMQGGGGNINSQSYNQMKAKYFFKKDMVLKDLMR